MLLALTMIMGIFTGCGAGGSNASMEKITVSEMLANVMEENSGEAIIFTYESDKYRENVSEKLKWLPYAYAKETMAQIAINGDGWKCTLDEFYSADSYVKSEKATHSSNWWYLDVTREESVVQYIPYDSHNKDAVVTFGECEHVIINDESYMLFKSYKYDYIDGFEKTCFTLIKDTEYTKDKLVIADSAENVSKTREWYLDSKFSDHAWFSELTDEDKASSGIED